MKIYRILFLPFLAVVLINLFATQVLAQEKSYVTGDIIVKFDRTQLNPVYFSSSEKIFDFTSETSRQLLTNPAIRDSLKEWGVKELRKVVTSYLPQRNSLARNGVTQVESSIIDLAVLNVGSADINTIIPKLEALDGVIYAEPNFVRSETSLRTVTELKSYSNDTHFSLQKSLEQASNVDINAAAAWAYNTGSDAVRVGVVDSGIDYDHPDLGDGFGLGEKVVGGYDYGDDDSDPDTGVASSHGTHVAGIIGAIRNNNLGIAGIAGGDNAQSNTGVALVALKARNSNGNDPYHISDIVNAIVGGASSTTSGGFGVDILNIALAREDYTTAEREAINFAAQNGVVVVLSKGNFNDTTPIFPGDYDPSWSISVGASDNQDRRMNASSYGNGIDIVAPGDPTMIYTTTDIEDGSYDDFEFTSAAAPHVAGVAALILSEASDQNLVLHPDDVEGILKASAFKDSFYSFDNAGWNDEVGHGRLDAGNALSMLQSDYQFDHLTTTGGNLQGQSASFNVKLFNAPSGLTEGGLYTFKRHAVHKNVSFTQRDEAFVWGRGVNESTGWPGHELEADFFADGFTEVVPGTITSSSATLRTYVYKVYEVNHLGQQIYRGWYPTTAPNVVFKYTVVGKLPPPPPPVSVTLLGPSFLGWKDNATLTASTTGGGSTILVRVVVSTRQRWSVDQSCRDVLDSRH